MGILTVDDMGFDALRAALAWQVELGACEAIGDVPVNRYETPAAAPKVAAVARAAPAAFPDPVQGPDPVDMARAAASGAQDLEALRAALAAFDGCELKRGARNTVFADGVPGARVMVIGDAPERDGDVAGKPFAGRAAQLLDRMFEAIGMSRTAEARDAIYFTNILPWCPPRNHDIEPAEIAMLLPFVERHVELAKPEILVLMGNMSCHALLGRKGITRLRGAWAEALGRPALPMFHPSYLLLNPTAKREAWADLLMLQARLR